MKLSIGLSVLVSVMLLPSVLAWGNGMSVLNNPTFANSVSGWTKSNMYGTHDYLAQLALEFLPDDEKAWVSNVALFYGTELPDSSGYDESINDRSAQHVYFDTTGVVTDDLLANRSMKKYESVINELRNGVNSMASKFAGAILSYVSDAGLFSRVLKDPQNGLRYEGNVLIMMTVYPSEKFQDAYGSYIKFDGQLEMISPYDAVMKVAKATYMGKNDGSCSAEWMDENYDPENQQFIACAGRNLNNAVNAMADVMHTMYQAGVKGMGYELYAYDWKSPAETPGEETPAENPPAENPPAENPPSETENKSGTAPPETGTEQPVPEPKRTAEGGAWMYIIAIVVIAAIGLIAFREFGRKNVKSLPVKKVTPPAKIKKK